MAFRTCTLCDEEKPDRDFSKRGGKRTNQCKACINYRQSKDSMYEEDNYPHVIVVHQFLYRMARKQK